MAKANKSASHTTFLKSIASMDRLQQLDKADNYVRTLTIKQLATIVKTNTKLFREYPYMTAEQRSAVTNYNALDALYTAARTELSWSRGQEGKDTLAEASQ